MHERTALSLLNYLLFPVHYAETDLNDPIRERYSRIHAVTQMHIQLILEMESFADQNALNVCNIYTYTHKVIIITYVLEQI